jgi:tetratricopeptide (TPR) repeat protein
MAKEQRSAPILLARHRDQAATTEGAEWGPKLLEFPPSSWRRHMRSNRHYRSFGTLRWLLGHARSKFTAEPTVALQITAAVLDFVDGADGPSAVHEIGIRGLARKEHANALRSTGDLRAALKYAEASAETYLRSPALVFDATQANLVVAQVLREMGEHEKAMTIARECTRIFDDFGEATYRIMSRHAEGCILFARKQFKEALSVFSNVVAQAEQEGDRNMLVRGLHNAAEAAREMGDIQAARDLYPRVLKHMHELELTTELPRVTWGYALTLAAENRFEAAVSELYKVSNLYLHFGMNLDAATAHLDIVRIRFSTDEDITEDCRQLVETFANAGAAQNALEALAYLREQARCGQMTMGKLERVRTYFTELQRKPNLLFARPGSDGEDQR